MTTILYKRVHAAAVVFCDADDAWDDELRRLFGNRAGDIRYTKQGEGAPGSELRRLWEKRTYAMMQWDMARQDIAVARQDAAAQVPLFSVAS